VGKIHIGGCVADTLWLLGLPRSPFGLSAFGEVVQVPGAGIYAVAIGIIVAKGIIVAEGIIHE
jgi:hypothetical protein